MALCLHLEIERDKTSCYYRMINGFQTRTHVFSPHQKCGFSTAKSSYRDWLLYSLLAGGVSLYCLRVQCPLVAKRIICRTLSGQSASIIRIIVARRNLDVPSKHFLLPLLSYVGVFSFCFVLSCLACTVLCSALLLDARSGVHFFIGSPDISYFVSTDFDRDQLL